MDRPFHAWSSASEAQRLRTMTQVARQQEFIASRYLLRKRLACAVFGIEDQWHTLRIASAAGQPLTWCDPQAPDRSLHLSLSHSHGWLLAYAGAEPLGIDIEVPSQRRRNMARLMGHMASPPEQAHFAQLSSHEQTAYFYTLWTQKEAYLKCTGEGMDVSKLPELSAMSIHGAHCVGHMLSYRSLDRSSGLDFYISVCSVRHEDAALQLPADCWILQQDHSAYYCHAVNR